MAFSLRGLFDKPRSSVRRVISAPGRTYRTTEQLNAVIESIGSLEELQRFLKSAMMVNFGYEDEAGICSCSGSANAVLTYLFFGRVVWGGFSPMDGYFARIPGNATGPDYVSPEAMAARLLSHKRPCAAVLEETCGRGSHVAVLANTGGNWTFYQSNVGRDGGNGDRPGAFTLSARVNARYKVGEKCRPGITDADLPRFFRELVSHGNHETLFYGTKYFFSWKIALFGLDGRQLDLSR